VRVVIILALAIAPARAQTPSPLERAHDLNELGVADHEAGRLGDAVRRFRAAIAALEIARLPVDPTIQKNLAGALIGRASAEIKKGALDAAVRTLVEARAVAPGDARVHAWLGVASFRQGYYVRARAFLSDALERDDGLAFAHAYLGHALYRLENIEGALAAWARARALDPGIGKELAPYVAKAKRELAVESAMLTERTTHFACKYDRALDRRVASRILDWLEDSYAKFGEILHAYPAAELTVILYGDREFTAVTGQHPWAAGLFDGKIRIPVKRFDARAREIESTLRHEFMHFLVSRITRRAPAWLDEGLAQWAEGKDTRRVRRVLVRARDGGKLAPMSSLVATFARIRDAATARLRYAQALSFTLYLMDRFTVSDVERFLRALQPGRDRDEVFYDTFRRRLTEVDADWRAALD